MKTTPTKKEIVKTLRTYNVTAICKIYKRIFGTVPMEEREYHINGESVRVKSLNGYTVYEWACQFATSCKMNNKLFLTLERAAHHWNHDYEDNCYRYAQHGSVKPLRRQYIVNYLLEQCKNPTSNYAKRPMCGYTHLYFCSPIYGHSDYNKWRALPIDGNEDFCNAVIKYSDKYFNNK